MRIWVVTDGRAGNENPALGLAEAISAIAAPAAGSAVEVKRIEPRAIFAWMPARLWAARFGAAQSGAADLGQMGAAVGASRRASAHRRGWPFTGLRDRGASLDEPAPDLVIGAGRRSAPIVAALRRRGAPGDGDAARAGRSTTAVQLLNPQMRLAAFDLVIAPRHDRLVGSNVHQTVGSLHRLTPARLETQDRRLDRLPRPLVSVLLGGPSRSARFEASDLDHLLSGLRATAERGAGLAITASRRTPDAWVDRLRAALRADQAWIWGGATPEGDNPFFAMLGAAQAIVVTADSVNMASEACSTGKPVFVAPLSKLAPKLVRFHEALRDGGHVRSIDDLAREGLASDWSPTRLDDVDHAARAVLTAMQLDSCPAVVSD